MAIRIYLSRSWLNSVILVAPVPGCLVCVICSVSIDGEYTAFVRMVTYWWVPGYNLVIHFTNRYQVSQVSALLPACLRFLATSSPCGWLDVAVPSNDAGTHSVLSTLRLRLKKMLPPLTAAQVDYHVSKQTTFRIHYSFAWYLALLLLETIVDNAKVITRGFWSISLERSLSRIWRQNITCEIR